ncbi:sulfatase-like hydrolase/transferase [Paenibacillus koleovorans]|uniref:sulfatase-like hydrolase/transferase n=1 Tax=Paenibacillus koleovorans TaxID=121608 RepID=UPI0013E3C889|nr:sulfatase-like hydrolase/transferase [Paenibacillus koleovorans]
MKRPNIVIFMTDQQHADTIGEQGLCRTPHLNALMNEGVRFTEAYTNCPMCTPARATALTGLHPHEHKMVQNSHSPMALINRLEPQMETIGTALRKEGYRTIYSGKWHVGTTPPEQNGFDRELPLGKKPEIKNLTDPVIIQDRFGEHVLAATAAYSREETRVFQLSEAVNNWLEEEGDGEQPFLLVASCLEPHVPWIVPEPYGSMYNPDEIEAWPNYEDDYQGKPLTYSKHYNDVNYCRIRKDWGKTARALAKYFGAVSMVDDAFGSIIGKLSEKGLLEDTIIVFTSDHGELMGRHGLIGKNELALDDISRIPLVLYSKGRFKPAVCDRFVLLSDLFNTVMELAGAEQRESLHSQSFAAALRGEAYDGHDSVVIQHHGATVHMNTMRAIRNKDYKYVFRPHEVDEFYDMRHDPGERDNRIGDPAMQERIWEMKMKLLAWAKHTSDFAYRGMERSFANPDPVDLPISVYSRTS